MPEALALVKRQLGPDAIILGTRHLGGDGPLGSLLGRRGVEITASPDRNLVRSPDGGRLPSAGIRADAANQPRATGLHALPDELLPFYQKLIADEVSVELAAQLAREAAPAIQNPISARRDNIHNAPAALRGALRESIARRIPPAGGIQLTPGKTRRVVLIGPPGGGKTTTLGKLAAHFALRMKKNVAILSLDMHRLATHDQVRRYADLIGVPVFTAQTVSAVRDVLKEISRRTEIDLLLIDTHGVSPRERGRFARLAALLRAIKADEIHLVLPASLASSVQDAVIRTFSPFSIARVVITKLDETVGLGVVLNALEKLNWGLSYITNGQRVPTDLHEATASSVADLLVPADA